MILQYDDIVLQVVDRLRKVIPQQPKPVARIAVMQSFQKDLEAFYQSQETSKILVTYSGNSSEGGRAGSDFVKTIGRNSQYLAHTIEVHICAKQFMYDSLNSLPDTMLRLMWSVRAGLVGLKFYRRDAQRKVLLNDPDAVQTEGMFSIDTTIDRQVEGKIIAGIRFQVLEMVPEMDDVNPEIIWGTYQEIKIEEYSAAASEIIDNAQSATETITIT